MLTFRRCSSEVEKQQKRMRNSMKDATARITSTKDGRAALSASFRLEAEVARELRGKMVRIRRRKFQ